MSKSSLNNLLTSIQAAIVGAQDMLQNQHVEELKKYINDDGSPVTHPMKLPRHNAKGEIEWTDIEVPLLVLCPPASLKMKKLKINFDAILSGLGQQHEEDAAEQHIQLKLGGLFSRGAKVHCEIQFEGTKPPEGWMRINDELVKAIP